MNLEEMKEELSQVSKEEQERESKKEDPCALVIRDKRRVKPDVDGWNEDHSLEVVQERDGVVRIREAESAPFDMFMNAACGGYSMRPAPIQGMHLGCVCD